MYEDDEEEDFLLDFLCLPPDEDISARSNKTLETTLETTIAHGPALKLRGCLSPALSSPESHDGSLSLKLPARGST